MKLKVSDQLLTKTEGQSVKVLEVDDQGRVRLSIIDAMEKKETRAAE